MTISLSSIGSLFAGSIGMRRWRRRPKFHEEVNAIYKSMKSMAAES